jgi:hypothetical protein
MLLDKLVLDNFERVLECFYIAYFKPWPGVGFESTVVNPNCHSFYLGR